MSPLTAGVIVFVCTLGGALAGIRLRVRLPEHHVDDESKDTIKLGIGLVATMTALVLGLVTASAKSAFDDVDTAVKQATIEILTLDRLLARYGPETGAIRQGLQQAVARRVEMLWPKDAERGPVLDPAAMALAAEQIANGISALTPPDEVRRELRTRALDRAEELLQGRWMALAASRTSIPPPLLVVLVFWLTITFASFGLFAPNNVTVLVVFLVCAVSVGSAVFLILEMGDPFEGVIMVSEGPLRYAETHLNK